MTRTSTIEETYIDKDTSGVTQYLPLTFHLNAWASGPNEGPFFQSGEMIGHQLPKSCPPPIRPSLGSVMTPKASLALIRCSLHGYGLEGWIESPHISSPYCSPFNLLRQCLGVAICWGISSTSSASQTNLTSVAQSVVHTWSMYIHVTLYSITIEGPHFGFL